MKTDDNGNLYNLGGVEVVIRDWWSTGEITRDSAYEDARADYLEWAQATYNFTIKEIQISDWSSVPEDFEYYVLGGGSDDYYVFCLRPGEELAEAMNEGYMYDVSILDCLDFTDTKWSSDVHNKYTGSNGEIYAFRGAAPDNYAGIYFNKRILEEAGIDPYSIYDMQREEIWTWEAFEDICAKVQRDFDNDGIYDIWGMSGYGVEFCEYAVYSNGGHFINKIDGRYVSELEAPNTMEALNWATGIINQYQLPLSEDDNWDYYVNGFTEGRACFCVTNLESGARFVDMEDDYGFVAFPMGPVASEYTNVSEENVYAIPSCYDAEKAWKIAFAYNLYTEPIPGYESVDAWKNASYYKFRDEESVDSTLDILSQNCLVTYHSLVPGISLNEDVLWNLAYPGSDSPAYIAEQIRNDWNAYIDAANY